MTAPTALQVAETTARAAAYLGVALGYVRVGLGRPARPGVLAAGWVLLVLGAAGLFLLRGPGVESLGERALLVLLAVAALSAPALARRSRWECLLLLTISAAALSLDGHGCPWSPGAPAVLFRVLLGVHALLALLLLGVLLARDHEWPPVLLLGLGTVATGVPVQVAQRADTWPWHTPYDAFAVLVGVATVCAVIINRFRRGRAIAMGAAAFAVGASAVLAAATPGRLGYAYPLDVTVVLAGFGTPTARIHLDTTRAGPEAITVRVAPADTVSSFTVSVFQGDPQAAPPVREPLGRLAGGDYAANVTVSGSGPTRLTLDLRTASGDAVGSVRYLAR